tara:strand:- start:171 stop:428 length:258 start_codon:yes stop_codon:yes gene_type:complete
LRSGLAGLFRPEKRPLHTPFYHHFLAQYYHQSLLSVSLMIELTVFLMVKRGSAQCKTLSRALHHASLMAHQAGAPPGALGYASLT